MSFTKSPNKRVAPPDALPVLSRSHGHVSVNTVVRFLWQYRDNTQTVENLCLLLQESADEIETFQEIEKMLLQIVHLAIHAGKPIANSAGDRAANGNTRVAEAYERLVLTLAQLSSHLALKIRYALLAAVEDYVPELPSGQPNPRSCAYTFYRCARLLQNVERAMLYGAPILTSQDAAKLEESFGRDATERSLDMERKARLQALIDSNNALGVATGHAINPHEHPAHDSMRLSRMKSLSDTPVSGIHGLLLHKRQWRRTWHSPKGWKWRYFRIEQQVLFCTRDASDAQVARAMHLAEASVTHVLMDDVEHNRRRYSFVLLVRNRASGQEMLLRADDKDTFESWKAALERECGGVPSGAGRAPLSYPPPLLQYTHTPSSSPMRPASRGADLRSASPAPTSAGEAAAEADADSARGLRTLTARTKRWTTFTNELQLMSSVTDICERLRFMERPMRGPFLRRDLKRLVVPPLCYVPLRDSLDPYATVLRVVHQMGHAFQTKARCPCLVFVETEVHAQRTSVATFLQWEVQDYSIAQIASEVQTLSRTTEGVNVEVLLGADDRDPGYTPGDMVNDGEVADQAPIVPASSRLSSQSKHVLQFWRPDGAAVQRLRLLEKPGVHVDESATQPAPVRLTMPRSMAIDAAAHKLSANTAIATTDPWADLRKRSPYGHLPTWEVDGFIAKSNDDLRQEIFVMQLISYYQAALRAARCEVYLRTYHVMNTGKSTGVIQLIRDSSSIDGIKKKPDYPGSLRRWFVQKFGDESEQAMLNLPITSTLVPLPGTESLGLKAAIRRFAESLAGYSMVSYMLAIKDRHNGNILLTADGRIVHIDFGFVFGIAPGNKASMETCPFKLTTEFLDVLGGHASEHALLFRVMVAQALSVARRHASTTIKMVEIMAHESSYPCFRNPAASVSGFIARHHLDEELQGTDKEKEKAKTLALGEAGDNEHDLKVAGQIADRLIHQSYRHLGTRLYDQFQLLTNGIYP